MTNLKKDRFISYNNLFLLFLILFTQRIIPLKILGLALIYIFYPVNIFTKDRFVSRYYLYMLMYAFLSSIPYLNEKNYVFVFIIGIVFWLLSFLAIKQIYHFVRVSSINNLDKMISRFFYFVSLFTIINYIQLVSVTKSLFPFLWFNSSGDYIKSIFSNSSASMIIFCFFIVYFYSRGKIIRTLVATILSLASTYMSGIFVMVVGFAIFGFISLKLKFSKRIAFLGIALVTIWVTYAYLPTNYNYSKQYLNKIYHGEYPRKIISFEETISNFTSSPSEFIFGAGMGNFSSRLAFLTSGDYTKWYSEDWVHINDKFLENHFALWNTWLLSKMYMGGTANQPFSVYNRIIGEYGLIGILLFIFYYVWPLYKYSEKVYSNQALLILMVGYFFLDYWFEYFSVIIIFEFLILVNKKNQLFEYAKKI